MIYKQSSNLTIIPNKIITDIRVNSKSLRIYLYLYSKPDNWEIDFDLIIKTFKREIFNKIILRNCLENLEKTGWISKDNNSDYQLNSEVKE